MANEVTLAGDGVFGSSLLVIAAALVLMALRAWREGLALIGVVVNAMIVLMCGPLIDGLLARRGRSSSR